MVYDSQRTIDAEALVAFAEQIGLDMDRFRSDLESDKYAPRVREDHAERLRIGFRGTPTLYLNGVMIGGALPAASLRARLDQALGE